MYNEFFGEVYGGNYGAYYYFLLEELELGPYWSDIKAQLRQVQEEYDLEASVSGSRGPRPTDTSSFASSSRTTSTEESSLKWLQSKSHLI